MDPNRASEDLRSIREMMERSVRFLSFSGWAGILAGSYALIAAAFAFRYIYPSGFRLWRYNTLTTDPAVWKPLLLLALLVLLLSVATAVYFTQKKARQLNIPYWNATARQVLTQASVPLLAGGILTLGFVSRGYFMVVAPSLLVFYGLALLSAAPYTWKEVRWMGYAEVITGIAAVFLPGYGLFFWAFGFGVLHILYGFLLYSRYRA